MPERLPFSSLVELLVAAADEARAVADEASDADEARIAADEAADEADEAAVFLPLRPSYCP